MKLSGVCDEKGEDLVGDMASEESEGFIECMAVCWRKVKLHGDGWEFTLKGDTPEHFLIARAWGKCIPI